MKWIENIVSEVKGDISSCFNRASYFVNNSTSKGEKIFFLFVIVVFLIILFNSENEASFYLNSVRIILISATTFILLCLSDTFWFLLKKVQVYNLNIKNRKNINSLFKELAGKEDLDYNNYQSAVQSITRFYSKDYKYHAKRNLIEISLILLFLLFTFPTFFIFNLALFCGMFVYVFLYEQQSVNQAFEDISDLLSLINKMHKKSPEQCKSYILSNSLQEIKDLKILYNTVVRIE